MSREKQRDAERPVAGSRVSTVSPNQKAHPLRGASSSSSEMNMKTGHGDILL